MSSIPCSPAAGGPLQLYRHFGLRQDFEVAELELDPTPVWEKLFGSRIGSSSKLFRLRSSRLYPWFVALEYVLAVRQEAKRLLPQVQKSGVDAVLTVAFGRGAFVAEKLARIAGLPLVTIFHDWWPDLLEGLNPRAQKYLDRRFRQLARSSNLILPVSAALLEELGGHPCAVLLPPMPADVPAVPATIDSGSERVLIYAGSLMGAYGAMILDLANYFVEAGVPGWKLRVYGAASSWEEAKVTELKIAGIFGGLLPQGELLNQALAEADVLLVVADFSPENERRGRTSFPSKILDYAPFGKPLLAWGPEGSFATSFCRENKVGVVVNDARSSRVAESLRSDFPAEKSKDFGAAMKELNKGSHSPEAIHSRLSEALRAL